MKSLNHWRKYRWLLKKDHHKSSKRIAKESIAAERVREKAMLESIEIPEHVTDIKSRSLTSIVDKQLLKGQYPSVSNAYAKAQYDKRRTKLKGNPANVEDSLF